ncbi:MAG TPA: NAD(P)/FAD-dependent oxidoreductase [Thermoleophilaceae bacterium]|nr:NAD(P)/FAD-dependent oxidoreductase [Thermoleophilaceae bacterium]
MDRVDAVVVGGGHNGLVAAAYLARAGWSTLVLERLGEPGGAAVSARAFAGREDRLSRYSYLVSLFPERILRDLGIRIELRPRAVSAFAPPGLLVDADPRSDRTAAAFEAVTGSRRDHEEWLAWHETTAEAGRLLFPTLTEPMLDRDAARKLLATVPGAWDALVEQPLGEALRDRFDHGLVRGIVSSDGMIGTFADVDDPSLRQNRCFLYHVIGDAWRVPVGGMGALTGELLRAAGEAGAQVRCGAEVLRIDDAQVTWAEGGREHAVDARSVLAGVAPAELARLRGAPPPATPSEGSQTKLNLLLDRLPRLRSGTPPEDAFAGTFRLNEHEDQLAAAYGEAAAGRLPSDAPAEIYCHTTTDRSILGPDAPATRHTLTLFGLHTPARLFQADNDAARATMRERYLDALDEHLDEPIRGCIARDAAGEPCVEVKTPLDLEAELRMPGGHIFHGDLEWPWAEPGSEAGLWGVATDDPRIVLCGSGARRGGCVSGVGGHNAAMALLS